MAGEKPSEGSYETFDSGKSVVIPDGEEVSGKDSMSGLNSYTMNEADDTHGARPEVPSKK